MIVETWLQRRYWVIGYAESEFDFDCQQHIVNICCCGYVKNNQISILS